MYNMQEGFNRIHGDSYCRVHKEIIQVHNLGPYLIISIINNIHTASILCNPAQSLAIAGMESLDKYKTCL